MKDKTIVSGISLAFSLACYFYARAHGKDAVPYVMIGGFLGAILGETIVSLRKKDDDNDGDDTPLNF